jgi:hypothetical protein
LTTSHKADQKIPSASKKKKTVTMTFLAERVASNIFQGEMDDAIPLTAFLSAVQSEGSMFLPQRRTV